jgi:hypothetical protein
MVLSASVRLLPCKESVIEIMYITVLPYNVARLDEAGRLILTTLLPIQSVKKGFDL